MRRDFILKILHQTDGVFAVLLAHDRDFLVVVLHGVAREHGALERINEADAGIPFAVQRHRRVGGRRGQRRNFAFGKDLAARHRQAGSVRAQHRDHALVHQRLRGQRRLGAVGFVIAVNQLDLSTQHVGIQFVRQIEAFFFHRAARGGRAGHRLKNADLHGVLRQRQRGAEQSGGKQQGCHLFHRNPSSVLFGEGLLHNMAVLYALLNRKSSENEFFE